MFLSFLGRPVLLWTSLSGLPSLYPISFGLLWVHFHLFPETFWFLPWSHSWPIHCFIPCSSISMSLSVFECFPWDWFLASVPCGRRKCLIWFHFSWICWGLFCGLSCGLSLKMFHVHLKRMCILLLWGERLSLSIYISVKSISSRALFNATMSFIFCLEDMSIFDSGVLKSPSWIVLLAVSFFLSSKIFFMYLGTAMLGGYIFAMFMSSWWILPLSIMKSPSGSVYGPFYEVYFVWYEYCCPCFFSPSICLENLFPALHFQSVYVFCSKVGLL